jgi:hypothetical protein
MPKLEYGTCRSISDAEVQEVYVDVKNDSAYCFFNDGQIKAVIRIRLEAKAYGEYLEDCDYVDFINSGGVVKGG